MPSTLPPAANRRLSDVQTGPKLPVDLRETEPAPQVSPHLLDLGAESQPDAFFEFLPAYGDMLAANPQEPHVITWPAAWGRVIRAAFGDSRRYMAAFVSLGVALGVVILFDLARLHPFAPAAPTLPRAKTTTHADATPQAAAAAHAQSTSQPGSAAGAVPTAAAARSTATTTGGRSAAISQIPASASATGGGSSVPVTTTTVPAGGTGGGVSTPVQTPAPAGGVGSVLDPVTQPVLNTLGGL